MSRKFVIEYVAERVVFGVVAILCVKLTLTVGYYAGKMLLDWLGVAWFWPAIFAAVGVGVCVAAIPVLMGVMLILPITEERELKQQEAKYLDVVDGECEVVG